MIKHILKVKVKENKHKEKLENKHKARIYHKMLKVYKLKLNIILNL
jgi:hypothetical protein